MAKKPDSLSLAPDEKIMWNGKRAKRSLISSTGKGLKLLLVTGFLGVLLAGIIAVSTPAAIEEMCLLFIFLFLAGILTLPFMMQEKHQYAITNKRVFARRGLGTRKINEIPLDKVVNTTYQQGFIGRSLGFGDLQFNSAAGADQGVVFKGLKNVKGIDQRFKKIKHAAVDNDTASSRIEQTINIKADRYDSSPKTVRRVKKKKKNPPILKKKSESIKERETTSLKTAEESREKYDEEEKEDKSSDREVNFCKKCGYEIDEETIYCERCGFKIRDHSH